ncbi:MAG: tRNA uridine-5-carboxymethylaminomethyl(34) synthesis GTPase MnmE [Oscillospiraceae bacterium]
MADTIAALATPQGVGGIAVVRISGENSIEIASKVFLPANKDRQLINAKGYTALFGSFMENGVKRDEVIALVFRAPHSYTGEDVVELSCHGGTQTANALLRALYTNGAAPAQGGEFTKRAFLSGRISLTEAESVMDLINANSNAAAKAAVCAMSGALYNEIKSVEADLLVLVGHISAFTDYPEEDVEELTSDKINAVLNKSIVVLSRLVASYDKGAVLRQSIETAIVGSPNVGKSTLLNLLSGFERAIVTPIAGTTRDVVEQDICLGDVTLTLADTAGLRETEDIIEAEGIRRSYARMENAALIIAVFDASSSVMPQDIDLAQKCKGRPALAVLNKSDLDVKFDIGAIADCFDEIITISASKREFLDIVTTGVEKVLGISTIDTSAPMLANERQLIAARTAFSALTDAQNAINTGVTLDAVGVCVDDALAALYSLSGENASDAVIDEVFSKFCVGK